MSDASAFSKLVPGFDFLQGLVKNAGAALPNIGQWVAPTLNPEELEKRIQELKTVQFWLDQNSRMISTTIQALEVQRMTLSTLKTMNVSMQDLREAMTLKMPGAEAPAEAPAPSPFAAFMGKPAADNDKPGEASGETAGSSIPGMIDPMQWWGALTQQFSQIAASAMKEGAGDAARNLAGDMMKQGLDAANETLKQAAAMPAAVAQQAAQAASAATAAASAAATAAADVAQAVMPGVAQAADVATQVASQVASQVVSAATQAGLNAGIGAGAGAEDAPAKPVRKRASATAGTKPAGKTASKTAAKSATKTPAAAKKRS